MCPSYFEIAIAAIILVLPFLYESSPAFRFRLKFLAYYILVSLNACVYIPVFIFRPKDVHNYLLASYTCQLISPLLGIKWESRNTEHLKKDRAAVVVANHQTSLDILGQFELWPIMDKSTAIAKKELFYFWPFGLAAWLCGLIYIDRSNPKKAHEAMNAAGELVKEKKIKLWVYPEGTRRNTGKIHEFRKGAFHLAITAQLPIIPVVYSRYYFLDEKAKRFDSGKVVMTCLEPIPTEGLTHADIDALMDKTHRAMSDVYNEINKELSLTCNTSAPAPKKQLK